MANAPSSQKRSFVPKDREGHSPGEVIREIGSSAKDLIQSEIGLAREELKDSFAHIARPTAQAAIFGALLTVSILPLLASLIIGLGHLLNGRYGLSSLIVGIVCAAVGGFFTYRAYLKIKDQDLSLPRTRRTLQEGKETVVEKANEVKASVSGNVNNVGNSSHRRAS